MAEQEIAMAVHFWDKTTSANSNIAILYTHGLVDTRGDIVRHAWQEICCLHFPNVAAAEGQPCWAVHTEAHQSYLPMAPTQIKQKHIVVKLMQIFSNETSLIPIVHSQDFLWIECRAASEDTPSGWKDALQETAVHLNIAHPNKLFHLLLAIGWKCVFFTWDPTNTLQRPQLFVHSNNSTDPWYIDARLKSSGNFPWVDDSSGVFHPARAYTIECFSSIIENGKQVLANHRNLAAIEQYLLTIRKNAPPDLKHHLF